ncbi:hypothetical protein MTF65_01780 [Streptomyces sp. APSN-46.1]|uniref:hypothetical protein n=1 Tax=Streptomyces sp. APSN-46.1 TaxID=2929049 RepID=UPI001FB3208A|nr:hypothetical protein [Streptomyces sp. APSN-46.1]MCJ1676113.1 hypothetical protein [Streptomyces sp. APSN-46.1]
MALSILALHRSATPNPYAHWGAELTSAPKAPGESVTTVDHLVITAMDPVPNTLAAFNTTDAVRVVTIKPVGYAEAVGSTRCTRRSSETVPSGVT